jgi:hypothetical protein
MKTIKLKPPLLTILKNRFSKYFKMPEVFNYSADWFEFFEKNKFSEKFIMEDLSFSNLNILVDKFTIQLRVKLESIFHENNYLHKEHFLIREIQYQYMFYTLTRKAYIKCIAEVNASIEKNRCAFF